jgi:hypothetical protein
MAGWKLLINREMLVINGIADEVSITFQMNLPLRGNCQAKGGSGVGCG